MAARSRAIAARSLMTATAVASPPAPVPKTPVSPECTPVTIAAFRAPVGAGEVSQSRGTTIGATHAVQRRRAAIVLVRARSGESCAVKTRAREVVRRDLRRRTGFRSATGRRAAERQRAENRELRGRIIAVPDPPTDPIRESSRAGYPERVVQRAAVASMRDRTAWSCLEMATMRVMRSPARPSPIARTIGIAPPTAASKRSCRP